MRNAEKPSLQPSTRLMPTRKRIALVAHDNQKETMAFWALKHRTRLIEHELYATAHTADIIAEVLNAPVFRFLSGPLGGDQQIGSRIAESRIDVLIFFWDPLGHQPHDSDVKALLRLATAWNIPNACNEATADCIISSPLFDAEPQAVGESPNQKSAADVAPAGAQTLNGILFPGMPSSFGQHELGSDNQCGSLTKRSDYSVPFRAAIPAIRTNLAGPDYK